MAPVWAYSPMVGFHSVKTSGGSPAATALRSLASPSALGTLSWVTWILGWVALNSDTICLVMATVAPDHMFHHTTLATPLPPVPPPPPLLLAVPPPPEAIVPPGELEPPAELEPPPTSPLLQPAATRAMEAATAVDATNVLAGRWTRLPVSRPKMLTGPPVSCCFASHPTKAQLWVKRSSLTCAD